MHRTHAAFPPNNPRPSPARAETQVIIRLNIPSWTALRESHLAAEPEEIPACPACRGGGCRACVGTGLTSEDVDFAGLLRERRVSRQVA